MWPPLLLKLAGLLISWLVLPQQAPTTTTSTISKAPHGNNRKEIVIHRIKSPRLAIHFLIDDLELGIDDPTLYYDHCYSLCPHNNAVYYLATWKDESLIIGMAEVAPDLGDNDDCSVLQGLWVDDVVTARRYQRKGVGTAIFQAIETDANELMAIFSFAYRENNSSGIESRPEDGRIEMRLNSVQKRAALSFYRSMGFQFEPWQDDDNTSSPVTPKEVRKETEMEPGELC